MVLEKLRLSRPSSAITATQARPTSRYSRGSTFGQRLRRLVPQPPLPNVVALSHQRRFSSGLAGRLEANRERREVRNPGETMRACDLLRVIEGGLHCPAAQDCASDAVVKLRGEGQRRLRQAGIERYESRQRVTGRAIPPSLKFFKLQIEFAVQALSQMSPLPADYMSDRYWPLHENRADLG